jgi:RND family efflux transporter MFP subunit
MMKFLKQISPKQIILLCIALVFVGSITALFLHHRNNANPTVDSGPNYEPTQVSRGSFTVTVSADGTLIAADTLETGFYNEGVVGSIEVKAGDMVSEGDILAELSDLDDLQTQIAALKIEANQAQKNYDYALNHPEVALAEAQATLAATNLAADNTQKELHRQGDGRCSDDTIESYYFQTLNYKQQADVWQNDLEDGSGYGQDYILEHLNPLLDKYRQAYINWQYCQGYTGEEITNSELARDKSLAEQAYAQVIVDKIALNDGIDTDTLAILAVEANLAQLKLNLAEMQLQGSQISAPCDGLILSVNAQVGDEVQVQPIISIARNTVPVLQFAINESDYTYMTNGVRGQVVFDALPEKIFSGTVSSVDLSMDSSYGFSTIKGLFTLDNSPYFDNVNLPYGMMGTINMTVKEVKQALLVPLKAVLSDKDGTPYVYVMNHGLPEKREIEVGVQGDTTFEVLSGLQEGEFVATGFDDISDIN